MYPLPSHTQRYPKWLRKAYSLKNQKTKQNKYTNKNSKNYTQVGRICRDFMVLYSSLSKTVFTSHISFPLKLHLLFLFWNLICNPDPNSSLWIGQIRRLTMFVFRNFIATFRPWPCKMSFIDWKKIVIYSCQWNLYYSKRLVGIRNKSSSRVVGLVRSWGLGSLWDRGKYSAHSPNPSYIH